MALCLWLSGLGSSAGAAPANAPMQTTVVGHYGGSATAIAHFEHFALVGAGRRLIIYDLADPRHPARLGESDVLAGTVTSIAVRAPYAYVTDVTYAGAAPASSRLDVFDLGAPATPFEVSTQETIAGAHGLVVADGTLYLIGGALGTSPGVERYALADPARPALAASWGACCPTAIAVAGSYAYVTIGNALDVLDVTQPGALQQVATLTIPQAESVYVAGAYAYVTEAVLYNDPLWSGGGLHIVDVSVPRHPTEVGSTDILTVDSHAAAPVVWAVVGHLAYVAVTGGHSGDGGGLAVLDVSDPANVRVVGRLVLNADPTFVQLVGDTAYLLVAGRSLRIVDVSNPASPASVGFFAFPLTSPLAFSGGYAYAPDIDAGLVALDVQDPTQPVPLAYDQAVQRPLLQNVWSLSNMALSGSLAYVVTVDGGLDIVSLSNPAQPALLSSYHPPSGYANSVGVAGTIAFIAESPQPASGQPGEVGGGLASLDVSDPAHPVLLDFVAGRFGAGNSGKVIVADGKAYVWADRTYLGNDQDFYSVRTFDVADPAHLSPAGLIRGLDVPIAASGRYLYITTNGALLTFDVSNAAAPVLVSTYTAKGQMVGAAAVSERYAFLQEDGDVRILDLADAAHPAPVGAIPIVPGEQLLGAHGALVYLLTSDGVDVAQISSTASDEQPGRGWISGHVYLTGTTTPVAGAVVEIRSTPFDSGPLTDGAYQFAAVSVAAGANGGPTYTVTIIPPPGYRVSGLASQQVTVRAGQGVRADFAVEPIQCSFMLGFKALHADIPAIVGDCLDGEQHNPANGDGLQHTTRGLLVWRKADNFTAFTDGYRTWVNGPAGLQERLNTKRFPWEANPSGLPIVS